jgi:hypothetical protein
MNKKTKKVLIVGGLAAAALGVWYFFFNTPAAGSAATATSSASSGSPTSVNLWTLASNATEVATIVAWINSGAGPNWLPYMSQYATQADIDTMYTLISQYWDTHTAPPYSLDNYYTALAAKVNAL